MAVAQQVVLKFLVVSESGNTPTAVAKIRELVRKNPVLVAFHGKDCVALEEVCDGFCANQEEGLEIVTTSHPSESLHEVKEFVEDHQAEYLGRQYLTFTI
jgi:hypothetical protein